jgi:chromosome segregation ATPase
VFIPDDVWDLTYAELDLKYAVKSLHLEYSERFPITTVKNVLWEELEESLESLSEKYQQLNGTYWQLNSSFELLNQTYWELQQNYTALKGSINELDNTRTAVAALAITTVFFVATTVYMVMRKPKQYW